MSVKIYFKIFLATCFIFNQSIAQSWRSSLYPGNWTPPVTKNFIMMHFFRIILLQDINVEKNQFHRLWKKYLM